MRRVSLGLFICLLFVGCINVKGSAAGLLEKMFTFSNGEIGYCCLNSRDDSLLINYIKGTENGVYCYKGNQISKTIRGVPVRELSHDGRFYSYIKNNVLYICDEKDRIIQKISQKQDGINRIFWSWDSKYLFLSIYKNENTIYRIDIATGKNEKICSYDDCYGPVLLKNDHEIFLMQEKDPNAVVSDYNLVKYNITSKRLEPIKLPPIKDLYVYDDSTISPNGKWVIFQSRGIIYVVDLERQKVSDKITIPESKVGKEPDVGNFSWRSDSTFVVFRYSYGREYGILKYTLSQN